MMKALALASLIAMSACSRATADDVKAPELPPIQIVHSTDYDPDKTMEIDAGAIYRHTFTTNEGGSIDVKVTGAGRIVNDYSVVSVQQGKFFPYGGSRMIDVQATGKGKIKVEGTIKHAGSPTVGTDTAEYIVKTDGVIKPIAPVVHRTIYKPSHTTRSKVNKTDFVGRYDGVAKGGTIVASISGPGKIISRSIIKTFNGETVPDETNLTMEHIVQPTGTGMVTLAVTTTWPNAKPRTYNFEFEVE